METLPEIILIDKPVEMTSFDVIRVLRKKTGIRKFGHAGTLDPLASGLMILGVNEGTKKLTQYIKLDKEYITEVRFGEERTTGDLEGDIVTQREVDSIEGSVLESAVKALVGTHVLPVSAYSAIKKEGKPMYKRAREAEITGKKLEDIPLREMTVLEAELLSHGPQLCEEKNRYVAQIRFHVESGVYIRSLAVELGRLLGYPSTVQSLRRIKIGTFDIVDAHALEEF